MPLPIAFGVHSSIDGSGVVGGATSHKNYPFEPRLGECTNLSRLAGSPGWAVEARDGEESLTELDTLPASEDRQQADDAVWKEVPAVSSLCMKSVGDAAGSCPTPPVDVGLQHCWRGCLQHWEPCMTRQRCILIRLQPGTCARSIDYVPDRPVTLIQCYGDHDRLHCPQVPPQAGPDVREGYLQRLASFIDQLLGRAAWAIGPKAPRAGEPLPSSALAGSGCLQRLADARQTKKTVIPLVSCYTLSELACFTLPWDMMGRISVHILPALCAQLKKTQQM